MRMMTTVRALLLIAATAMLSASPAAGQTRFEAPAREADVSAYTSVYDCIGATRRVMAELEAEEFQATGIWSDTVPNYGEERWEPLPPAVVETARTCLEATAEDAAAAPTEAWMLLGNLYLVAGWDDSARAVVDRRLEAVEPGDDDELDGVLRSVMWLYHGFKSRLPVELKPPQPEVGDSIVFEHAGKLSDIRVRLNLYTQMVIDNATWLTDGLMEDSEMGAHVRRNIVRVQSVLDSLTQREVQRWVDEGKGVGVARTTKIGTTVEDVRNQLEGLATHFFARMEAFDSLRVSTEAYTRFKHEAWSRASGQPLGTYQSGQPIGERAPTLEGDVWLGCEQDPCEPYPRPGRVSLLVFYSPSMGYHKGRKFEVDLPDLLNEEVGCAPKAIALRHLQDRFPELDVVIVTRTTGRYNYVKEGVTPEREAELLLKCFKSNGLDRVVVTMTETPGWRLPEPDGRRVDQPTANWTNYSFGGTWEEGSRLFTGSDLIVDQDGYVIYPGFGSVHSGVVKVFEDFIEVLMERDKEKT